MIGFSCGDQSWAPLPHQSAVELIALLGFEAIDLVLGVNPRHLLASDVAVRPSSLAAELAPLLERHSLRVADVFVGPLGDFETLAPNHPDESQLAESRELFLAVVEFAEAARQSRHHTGARPLLAGRGARAVASTCRG